MRIGNMAGFPFLFKKGCRPAGWAQRGRIQEEEGELGIKGEFTGDVHEKRWVQCTQGTVASVGTQVVIR